MPFPGSKKGRLKVYYRSRNPSRIWTGESETRTTIIERGNLAKGGQAACLPLAHTRERGTGPVRQTKTTHTMAQTEQRDWAASSVYEWLGALWYSRWWPKKGLEEEGCEGFCEGFKFRLQRLIKRGVCQAAPPLQKMFHEMIPRSDNGLPWSWLEEGDALARRRHPLSENTASSRGQRLKRKNSSKLFCV